MVPETHCAAKSGRTPVDFTFELFQSFVHFFHMFVSTAVMHKYFAAFQIRTPIHCLLLFFFQSCLQFVNDERNSVYIAFVLFEPGHSTESLVTSIDSALVSLLTFVNVSHVRTLSATGRKGLSASIFTNIGPFARV